MGKSATERLTGGLSTSGRSRLQTTPLLSTSLRPMSATVPSNPRGRAARPTGLAPGLPLITDCSCTGLMARFRRWRTELTHRQERAPDKVGSDEGATKIAPVLLQGALKSAPTRPKCLPRDGAGSIGQGWQLCLRTWAKQSLHPWAVSRCGSDFPAYRGMA